MRLNRIILMILLIGSLCYTNNKVPTKLIDQVAVSMQAGFDLKSSILIAIGLGASFGTNGINSDHKEKNPPQNKKKI